MCICLSVSLDIPSSVCTPLPQRQARHRRSVSDTLVVKRIVNAERRGVYSTQYSLDDTNFKHIVTQYGKLDGDNPQNTLRKTNIPVPPPPPPPRVVAKGYLGLPLIPIKEAIIKYNVYDTTASEPAPSAPPVPPPPPPPPKILLSCPVCFEEANQKDTIAFHPCSHSFCTDCVREHLTTLVSIGKKLKCLHPMCTSGFQGDRAKEIMDEKTYERYLVLLKTPAGAHRWCPRPGCDTPFIKADVPPESPRVTCKNPVCELEFCYECRVKWHEDLTCEEFKKKQKELKTEEELLSESYAKENLQACPNCSIWVEKVDGCEYVQCTACHHEFCWFCLEPHDHNMAGHVHGPNYAIPSATRKVRRRAMAIRIAKVAGIGIAACVLAPPAIAIGAAAAVVVLPVLAIRKCAKVAILRRKARKGSTDVRKWAQEEKKRREDLGLEVSDYVDSLV